MKISKLAKIILQALKLSTDALLLGVDTTEKKPKAETLTTKGEVK